MSIKNKKTRIFIGSSTPASPNLAAAITAASIGFGCTITSMNGLSKTRSATDEEAVYCDHESFKKKDTGELEISPFTATGLVDTSVEYEAVEALANAMIIGDTQGTFVLVEPNGTDKLWMEMKVLKWDIERGGAEDKKKFSIELLPMTLPKDV